MYNMVKKVVRGGDKKFGVVLTQLFLTLHYSRRKFYCYYFVFCFGTGRNFNCSFEPSPGRNIYHYFWSGPGLKNSARGEF